MNYDTRHRTTSASPTGLLEHAPRPGVVVADDGRELTTTTFEPVIPVVAVALIAPAMATPASYYSAFARHLAEHGVRTVTFDYRTGTGSADQMKAESADVDRWMSDASSVLTAAADEADRDGVPLTWIGHSLGAQIVPFVDHERLASLITIAAGDGYWRRNARGLRWKVPVLWWIVAPVAMALTGYFPGRRLGLGGDLPSGVLRQWSQWCRHPHYLEVDHPDAAARFAAVKTPMMSLSFTDDEVLSKASVDHLNSWYTGMADQVRQRYSPAQLEVERMGHHGFFRPQHAGLWDELVAPWIPTASAVA